MGRENQEDDGKCAYEFGKEPEKQAGNKPEANTDVIRDQEYEIRVFSDYYEENSEYWTNLVINNCITLYTKNNCAQMRARCR